MDNTELHYIAYDTDAIWSAMIQAYIDAGGDVLYPGDEKEMLLRGVQSIMVQGFANVDNALRMDTLRYAIGDYLDVYGEKRGCERIAASKATATVQFNLRATGAAYTIPEGTTVTADGETMYTTDADIIASGSSELKSVTVTCTEAGSKGNGMIINANVLLLNSISGVISCTCTVSAHGGNDKEDDETYRERIRTYGLKSVTTGPSGQYEAQAKAVSSEIVDAKAIGGTGTVRVILLQVGSTSTATLINMVQAALSNKSVRPLTDSVTVEMVTNVPYTLKVQYVADTEALNNVDTDVIAAKDEYIEWQDYTIGRAFNPDKLVALLYKAGATQVTFAAGSNFNGGTVEYTTIDADERCKGTITLTKVTSV